MVKVRWGAVARHPYSSHPGSYQWRPSGEVEIPPLPSKSEDPSLGCQQKLSRKHIPLPPLGNKELAPLFSCQISVNKGWLKQV